MPPKGPNGAKKNVVVKVIPPRKTPPKSFFEEYYYGVLAAEFVCVSLLFGAGGMGFYPGVLVGLLVTASTSVAYQFWQYSHSNGGAARAWKPKPRLSAKAVEKEKLPNPDFIPIRPAPRKPVPVGPDGKKKFPPSYFPPLRGRKPQQ
ncbi:MAG: hypothetical protein JSS69_18750 [Acidobacteria bacterium]|nr:hypothetical protein [Acidobacteriota bacterium]MBS1867955.1 hypothetical protein [Acidobacteriota bacterium]